MAAPTILAVGFVLVMYMGAGVNVHAATRALLLVGAASLGLTVVCGALMGDPIRGGLLALALVLAGSLAMPIAMAVAAVVAVALIVERMVSRGRPPGPRWRVAASALDSVAVILLIVLAIQFVSTRGIERVADDLAPPPALTATTPPGAPDIYILLLDGHLRPDRLHELFGADPGPFVDGLDARGFDVATGSRSNYIVTGLSVPSMVNMTHFTDLLRERGLDLRSDRPGAVMRSLINHGSAFEAFRSAGYEVVSISPGFEEVALRKADEFIDTGEVNEFEYTLLRATSARYLLDVLAPEFLADQHRSRVRSVFGAVVEVATRPSGRPRLVWAHVPSPHSPAVFGPAGGPHPPPPSIEDFFDDTAAGNGIDRATYARRYVDQVTAIDRLALEAIDGILEASNEPPVIVVVSDHGSGAGLVWEDLDGSDLDERTANLTAALTPGHPDLFGAAPTLINTFPTLLRAYAGQDVERVADTLYVQTDDVGTLVEIDPTRIRWP
jgi:hypothetical protein